MAITPPVGAVPSMQMELLQPGRAVGAGKGLQQAAGSAGDAAGAFGDAVSGAMDHLVRVQNTADAYARQAATGRLESVQDYMIAATEAQLTTQLTIAVRNRAVEAYQEIVRMQV